MALIEADIAIPSKSKFYFYRAVLVRSVGGIRFWNRPYCDEASCYKY